VVVNDLDAATDGTGASAGPAERTVKEIEDLGGTAVADLSTVATVEGGQAIVDTALEAFGRVDIVISNAGILRDKAFHNLTPELLDPVLDVHLKGAFHVLRPAWVKLREAGYGRVLVTASNAGILGNFGQTNYGAAKMGLVGLARVLTQEGARRGPSGAGAAGPSSGRPGTAPTHRHRRPERWLAEARAIVERVSRGQCVQCGGSHRSGCPRSPGAAWSSARPR
jgi:NAD(P)-dependent dehydrogenase (short-subunit alcohol dehydrogenase family)